LQLAATHTGIVLAHKIKKEHTATATHTTTHCNCKTLQHTQALCWHARSKSNTLQMQHTATATHKGVVLARRFKMERAAAEAEAAAAVAAAAAAKE